MEQKWKTIPGLPAEVVEAVTALVDELTSLLGEALRSVVLYGDLARGEFHPVSPGIDVLLVIEPLSREQLEAIARPLRRARWVVDLGFLLLSPADLTRSTDVFPIKFADLREHHILLHGEDLLSPLTIGREHLRLRCEQELRTILWRLRRQYMFVCDYGDRLQATLCEAFSTFLVTISGSLRARGIEAPRDSRARIDLVGAQYQVDAAVFHEVLALRDRIDAEIPLDDVRRLYWQLVEQLAALVIQVDREGYAE
ncbi:MAG: hypothetical protein KC609_22165 [Myxococcales bacterium]|nr:hypothetical protein [Myxococcales bacterium]